MTLKIHELPGDPGKKQKKKRVGRGEGSGWGRTAGKGNKGVQARSGRAKGGAFEGGQTPLVRRVPKYGFKNTSFRELRGEVPLFRLNQFDDGATIDRDSLHKAGLIRKTAERIKIIASKTALEKKVHLKGVRCSAGAKQAIEAKGGSVQVAE